MVAAECCGAGRRGWYAVLFLHVNWLLMAGILKSFGVMLPVLQEQFTVETWVIGWLIAGINGAAILGVPFSVPLEDKFGTRVVATVGGLLAGAFVILASFSNTAIQLMITSVLAGPCLCIVNVLARSAIGRYFTTNYAIASAIGTSGHAVGMMLLGPVTQLLLDTYGWRGTLLLIGALFLHLGVCGLLLRTPPKAPAQVQDKYAPIISTEEEISPPNKTSKDIENVSRISSLLAAIWSQRNLLGCKVCCSAAFWIATLAYCSVFFASSLWLIYFVAYAEAKGFSGYEAVTFTTAGGIGNLVVKILIGVAVGRGPFKLRWTMSVLTIISTVALLTLPWTNAYWSMIASAFIFNGFNGTVAALCDLYSRELLGVDELLSAFSWMELVATALQLMLGFYPGWIFDLTGSYDTAFIILACVAALPLAVLLLETVLDR